MAHSPDYDFIGFTFGEKWFKDIHVLHVSDGSRYNDNLAPTMQDKTVQVPGGHGTYYFGSYYTQRTFSVQIAYDSITEQDLRTLRQMTNWGVQKLVFDEQPYKTYYAKMTGTPQLKYICFDEGAVNRVYKGEGTLQFTCFEPFAHCVEGQKFEEYWMSVTTITTTIPIPNTDPVEYEIIETRNFPNAEEWLPASGIVAQGLYDRISSTTPQINVYNPGDIETPFYLYYAFDEEGEIYQRAQSARRGLQIGIYQDSNRFLQFNIIQNKENNQGGKDKHIRINSKNHLVEGGDLNENGVFTLSGNLYNEYIVSGDFFSIPVTGEGGKQLNTGITAAKIEYDYLYL